MVRPALIMLMAAIILSVFYPSGIIIEQMLQTANDRRVIFSCMADGGAIAYMSALMGNALERVVREPEERRMRNSAWIF